MTRLTRAQSVAAAGLRLLLACIVAGTAMPAHAYHYPWDQGHDTTTTVDPPKPGPEDKSCADPDITCSATRSPVYAATGQAIWRAVDAQLIGRPYLGIYRVYNSNDPVIGPFGNGWAVDFDIALYPALAGGTAERIFKAANGKRFVYVRQANGSFRTPEGRFDTVTESGSTATMTLPDGQRLLFAADGRLLQRIDSNGNVVNFSHDSVLRAVTIADTNGRSLALAYNAQGLVSTVTDHAARTWRYAYDSQGNLLSVTNPGSGVSRYTWQAYKPAGDAQTYQQLLSATDPSGVVQVSYTYSGNQVTSFTEGANRISYSRTYSNTSSSGTVTQTDSTGVSTSFEYGAQGLVTRDTDGIGGVTRYTYDANGRLTQVTDALGRVWSSTWDAQGRLTSSTNPLAETTTMQYSGTQVLPTRVTSPSGRAVTVTYDTRGNALTVTDAAGSVLRMSYTALGDLATLQPAGAPAVQIEVNAVGLPVRSIDGLGRISTRTYDTLGRLTSETNAAGETHSYGYDALDRLVDIVDPLNQRTTLAYDAAGRPISLTDPKGSVLRYEYDSNGRRSAEVAPDGRRTTYAYRSDNLLSQITWPDNTRINYDYDANKRITRQVAGNETITYTYNAVDRLLNANGPGGTVSFTHDLANRIVSETSGGRTHTVTRNADGERVRLDALGQSTVYTRDVRGLVTRMVTAAGTFDFAHDVQGRRTQLSYPNGSTVNHAYDAGSQLTSLTHTGAFGAAFQHSYDAAGRITRANGGGSDWSYAYDALGRLTQAVQGASTQSFAMDAVGNLLGAGRSYDLNHRLTGDSAKTYSYDQRGNLTQETERSSGARVVYTWNVKNQLLRIDQYPNATTTTPTRTLQFSYDPLGRRASKTDNGVLQRFVHDGDDLIGVLDAAGNVLAVNTFSDVIDEPLASTSGGTTRLHFANLQGSVVALATGASLTHSYRYGPYGETLTGSSADATPFRYTGREKDTDTLYFYRSRYYSTAMQRFISADRIGLEGGVNPYAYVDGDPIGTIDPTGEFGAAGAAGSAIFEVVSQAGWNWATGKPITQIDWRDVGAAAAVGAVMPKPLEQAIKYCKLDRVLPTLGRNLGSALKAGSHAAKHIARFGAAAAGKTAAGWNIFKTTVSKIVVKWLVPPAGGGDAAPVEVKVFTGGGGSTSGTPAPIESPAERGLRGGRIVQF